MEKRKSKLLKEQNELVKNLVLGIKQVIDGKTKPFK